MKKNNKETLKNIIIKHLIVLITICLTAVLILYISSYFTTLHPDAYRDMVRSIILVYGVCVVVYILYVIIFKRKNSEIFQKKINQNEDPIGLICKIFLVLTAINSLMMLTGYDTPKEGVFAYYHMLTRLFITSFIVIILMWKDFINTIKKISLKNNVINFYKKIHVNIFSSVSKIFTMLTIIYCIFMIAFQNIINPTGGALFYQILLGLIVFITTFIFVLRIIRKRLV